MEDEEDRENVELEVEVTVEVTVEAPVQLVADLPSAAGVAAEQRRPAGAGSWFVQPGEAHGLSTVSPRL